MRLAFKKRKFEKAFLNLEKKFFLVFEKTDKKNLKTF